MARLTREQNQALTREKLLNSAYEVMARDGYAGATIERISEGAGFSKGAFYSNFENKENIFLQLLERNAGGDVVFLASMLENVEKPAAVIDMLCEWANQHAKDKGWGLLAIDLLRVARRDGKLEERHLKLFRAQWEALGKLLLSKLFPFGEKELKPLYVGGIILELVYGGISSFMHENAPGDMVRIALTSMHFSHLHRHGKKMSAVR